jgi:hypothetical protein
LINIVLLASTNALLVVKAKAPRIWGSTGELRR